VVSGGTGDKILQELLAVEADVVVVGSHDKGVIQRYAWACLGCQPASSRALCRFLVCQPFALCCLLVPDLLIPGQPDLRKAPHGLM